MSDDSEKLGRLEAQIQALEKRADRYETRNDEKVEGLERRWWALAIGTIAALFAIFKDAIFKVLP